MKYIVVSEQWYDVMLGYWISSF